MYESKFKSQANDELFQVIMSLESEEECYRFFEDIMTIKELESISQRWQVVKMLVEDKTYGEIEEVTKASTATISRVNKCLQYGAGGYTAMVEKMLK
ncbi:MAG: YerC/YecD family TrpR-related protein [Clostridia bacterium]|nr:YerC/YecD family TrpR-related protein [Clostridia bacterium]